MPRSHASPCRQTRDVFRHDRVAVVKGVEAEVDAVPSVVVGLVVPKDHAELVVPDPIPTVAGRSRFVQHGSASRGLWMPLPPLRVISVSRTTMPLPTVSEVFGRG